MRTQAAGVLLGALILAGCGSASSPSGVATNPPVTSGGTTTASAPPSSAAASGTRTVLSPLGLNIRQQPSTSAPRLATAAQGAVLTVVGHTDQDGGWYQVMGQTVQGWITANPVLTAAGQFSSYQSQDRMFNVLYPQGWTFAESTADVVFHPINGDQTIVVRNGTQTSSFGPGGGSGFGETGQTTVVICGVTADLNQYTYGGTAPATPSPGTPGPLALLAQIRLRLDATHALAIDFNYNTAADLDAFSAFYNSMTFPFPQCELPAATPSPT